MPAHHRRLAALGSALRPVNAAPAASVAAWLAGLKAGMGGLSMMAMAKLGGGTLHTLPL